MDVQIPVRHISTTWIKSTALVNFTETGLPSGYSWYVNVSGQPTSGALAAGGSYTLTLKNGTYSYSAGSTNNSYGASPGVFSVQGTDQNITVVFSLLIFNVHFLASYTAPTPFTWYLNMSNGQKFNTSSNEISFTEPNSTYSYTIASGNKTYRPVTGSGNFAVSGKTVTENISFVQVNFSVNLTQTGLPSGFDWYIRVTGTGNTALLLNTTGPLIGFNVTNGTYTYSVFSVNKTYAPGNYTENFALNGARENFSIKFHRVVFGVTFNETGLPSGFGWSIKFSNGTSLNSTAAVAGMNSVNGTYFYRVVSANKTWAPEKYTGKITVSGKNATATVNFRQYTYVVSFTEKGLPTGSKWTITVGPHTYVVNGTTISLVFTNGTLHYSVSGYTNYRIFNKTGNLSINGNGDTVTITFTRQTGIISPLTYAVLVLVLGSIVFVAFVYREYNKRKK